MKTVSDEQIIAAILSHGTLKEAAAAVGIGERTLYDRMNNGEFLALYKTAKADIMRAAVVDLNNKMQAAINTVAEIMEDKNINPSTRLQAAQTILNHAGKYWARLQSDEQAAAAQIESNGWGFNI